MTQNPTLTLPLAREGTFFVTENPPQHPQVTLQLFVYIAVAWVVTQR